MSQIDIKQRHGLSLEAAQQLADDLAADLAEQFSIEYGWDEDVLYFERTGVHGQINVDQDTIHVQARLGFLLLALKPAIEAEIESVLAEHFRG
jgi:putative polyhydroxyalkanoate system protein